MFSIPSIATRLDFLMKLFLCYYSWHYSGLPSTNSNKNYFILYQSLYVCFGKMRMEKLTFRFGLLSKMNCWL